ncbi:MAG: hypothetical protein CL572_05245 [Alphaproteobacteria bacterium]|nr:hypothetical protein [Alphaproteobacteria bacterium]
MKIKYLKNISFFFSILFLFFVTILVILTIIISYKPIKLNFTNYFDRESKFFKKTDIKEIGDIYISFNKSSKNFELLIEDLLIQETYLPNTLISLDFTFSETIFDTSIKIFDADITVREENNFDKENINKDDLIKLMSKKIFFLKNFNVIELINSKLQIYVNENFSLKYSVDLNIKNDAAFVLLSELSSKDNFITINFDFSENFHFNFNADNFNIDFVSFFFPKDFLYLDNLKISGSSNILMTKDSKIENFDFNLFLNGKISYETNFDKKILNFNKDKLYGIFNDNELTVSFNFDDTKSIYSIGIKTKIKKTNPTFFLKINSIFVKNLLKIWPKNLMNSTFYWMNENSNGTLENVILEVDFNLNNKKVQIMNVSGKFKCKNIRITYMENMPEIKNINGNARIENSRVIFDVESGNSKNLEVISGNIDLYNLDTDFEKAKIDLNIVSENNYVVDYLKLTEIDQDNYNKLNDILGNVDLNLKLNFPLLVDLKAEEINYSANAKIKDGNYKLFDNQHELEDLDIEIKVNPDLVNFFGEGYLLDSKVEFTGNQIVRDNDIVDEIEGKFQLESKQLKKFLPHEIVEESSGILPINFSYVKGKDNFKFEGVGETEQLTLLSKFLGNDLNFSNGKLRFVISPYGENISGFLDIKTKNIDIEINSILSDFELQNLEILKFKSPNQDFSLSMKKQDFTKININGNKISIPTIKLGENSRFSNFDNVQFNMNLSEIIIGMSKFYNPDVNFKKNEGKFVNLFARLDGEKDYHTINLKDEENKKKFLLETNFAPGLFKIFDVDLKINTGSLKIEGEKTNDTDIYKGNVAGKDFVFLDAPFLANFITLFSLQGLAQKLKDGGIIFESLKGKYEFSDDKLRVIDSLLKGSELGIQFDTVVGFENDYFLTTGSVIPAYTINTLLTKFPIVGDIITAGSPEDGLIGAKFKVEKENGEYKISYNPISVFVPNLIKNFLGD